MNFARMITDSLTMKEVFSRYGFSPNSRGFICCPLHQEKTPSLGMYQNGRRWKCFGCGEGGSVIDFVMKYFP
jgi:DNA primase